jgi:hypothetical protein
MAGGITSGIAYFVTVVGSSDPPGIGSAYARPREWKLKGRKLVLLTAAPEIKNLRRVNIAVTPWLRQATKGMRQSLYTQPGHPEAALAATCPFL